MPLHTRRRVKKPKARSAEKTLDRASRTLAALKKIGARRNVLQIVPPRHVYRPSYLRREESEDHELLSKPLESPTGPGAADRFRNRAGSQIAEPRVTNVHLGPFWGDRGFFEGFSKSIVE